MRLVKPKKALGQHFLKDLQIAQRIADTLDTFKSLPVLEIGPWHFMVIATLVCFGVNENDAAAFALVVHTVQTVWTGLCGLFGVVALPLTNRENKEAPVVVS